MVPKQPLANTPEGVFLLSTADLDGDGNQDLVTVSASANSIIWHQNSGETNPVFSSRVVETGLDEISTVSAGDIDSDGDLDLLAATDESQVAWYENNGADQPGFTERPLPDLPHFAGALSSSFGDLDEDGDLDLLFGVSVFNDAEYVTDFELFIWYESDGAAYPEFSPRVVTTTDFQGLESTAISAVDLDSDGDLDVLSAPLHKSYFWHENTGKTHERFTDRTVATTYESLGPAFPADMDGDGDLDLITATNIRWEDPVSGEQDSIAWYENDGKRSPTFHERLITTNTGDAHYVSAADIDGDGDLDILAGSMVRMNWPAVDGSISWYENDGAADPTFSKRMIANPGGTPELVRAQDLDGDGAWEVFSGAPDDPTISSYSTTQRTYQLAEGETLTVIEDATDADYDALLYTVSHGADAEFFSIDATTGELTFADAPPVSTPEDATRDNVYEVYISVTDGTSVINRSLSVSVIAHEEGNGNGGLPDTESLPQ